MSEPTNTNTNTELQALAGQADVTDAVVSAAETDAPAAATDGESLPPQIARLLGLGRPEAPAQPAPIEDTLAAIDAATAHLQATFDLVEARLDAQHKVIQHAEYSNDSPEHLPATKDFLAARPSLWLNEAYNNIATGLMQLRRAVQQPTGF